MGNDFDDLIIMIITPIALVAIIGIFIGFTNITNKINILYFKFKHPNCKKAYFNQFMYYAMQEYPEEHICNSLTFAKIGSISITYRFGDIIVSWNSWKEWTFKDIDQHKIWTTVISDILLCQALCSCSSEKEKMPMFRIKEYAAARTYAHKYEDFIYELFAPNFYYSELKGYYYDEENDMGLHGTFILEKIKAKYLLSHNDAMALFKEFIKNDLVYPNIPLIRHYNKDWFFENEYKTTTFKLGDILIRYWNIISNKDLNINLWSRKHQLIKKQLNNLLD